MSDTPSSKLYTPAILGLSASLALYPWDETFERRARARSSVCGSSIELGLDVDETEAVRRIGVRLSACAIGQASAAVLANAIDGAPRERIEGALYAIEAWLAGEGEPPDWPGFGALEPALPHAGRHGALLLPWRAAYLALSSHDDASEALSSQRRPR